VLRSLSHLGGGVHACFSLKRERKRPVGPGLLEKVTKRAEKTPFGGETHARINLQIKTGNVGESA